MWKISMCWLYAITKYRYVPSSHEILAAIDDARRLGFHYMELEGVGSQLHTVAKDKHIIKRHCDKSEIKLMNFVPVLPETISIDSQKRLAALKDFQVGCEIAAYFETGMIQADTFNLPIQTDKFYDISKDFEYPYNPPQIEVQPKFDFWDFFENILVSSVSHCNDVAKEHGLKFCIEPRAWENISNVWALELLMREIKSSNLGAVLDVAHLAAQKMSPVQCAEMLRDKIFYVHASDSNFLTEDHLEIGTGIVDWKSFLKALKKHNFGGYIGIDVGGKEEFKPFLDQMYVNSKNYLENLMKKVSISGTS